jgi:hypothetical protein
MAILLSLFIIIGSWLLLNAAGEALEESGILNITSIALVIAGALLTLINITYLAKGLATN